MSLLLIPTANGAIAPTLARQAVGKVAYGGLQRASLLLSATIQPVLLPDYCVMSIIPLRVPSRRVPCCPSACPSTNHPQIPLFLHHRAEQLLYLLHAPPNHGRNQCRQPRIAASLPQTGKIE